jgi:hypothetical protein
MKDSIQLEGEKLVSWCDNTYSLHTQHMNILRSAAQSAAYDPWCIEMLRIALRGLATSVAEDYRRTAGEITHLSQAPAREIFADIMLQRFLDSWRRELWGDLPDDVAASLRAVPDYARRRIFKLDPMGPVSGGM